MNGAEENGVEQLLMRVHGSAAKPNLIYLPGLHGDWTLAASFRAESVKTFRFVEFTYPRTTAWKIEDYGNAVWEKLQEAGITCGWIVGESFGSLVAWDLVPRAQWSGLILAGGFVRHPYPKLALLGKGLFMVTPPQIWKILLAIYAFFGHFRHRNAPETAASLREFVARRTPQDIAAIAARMDLVNETDMSALAREDKLAVFQLVGAIDPVVPYLPVRRHLRKVCPGYRQIKIIWGADHTVLATEPERSCRIIEKWIKSVEGEVHTEAGQAHPNFKKIESTF